MERVKPFLVFLLIFNIIFVLIGCAENNGDVPNFNQGQKADERGGDNMYYKKLFYPGLNDCQNYRIPSMITTSKGTLVVAVDARVDREGDNPNNIDKYVTRSLDGGITWEPLQVVVDYPGRGDDGAAACDPCMLYDEDTNTIWMIFNHTPAGIGLWNSKPGKGFDQRGNKMLYDEQGNCFTLREDNYVYDAQGKNTGIMVNKNGDVVRDGEIIGNIYLKSGPLLEARTSFLQAIKSEDDGLTWSDPIDLNPQVKEEWMGFIGAGPGVGIQLKKGKYAGRLIFPIYYTNEHGYMSCCVIYSDDHGKTWYRGESPNDGRIWEGEKIHSKTLQIKEAMLTESQVIELENGDLKMYMRNHAPYKRTAVAVSKDGGQTWGEVYFDDVLVNPICQFSVIKHRFKDGVTRTIWSNPAHETQRVNGVIRLSEDDGSTWSYSRVITEGGYAYSCLSVLPNDEICLLYEPDDQPGVIMFAKFDLDWIKGKHD